MNVCREDHGQPGRWWGGGWEDQGRPGRWWNCGWEDQHRPGCWWIAGRKDHGKPGFGGVVTGRTRAILQKGARTPPNDIITAAEPIHPLNPAKHLF